MMKSYYTKTDVPFIFNNSCTFFLNELWEKNRFIGKIYFQIITDNKLENVDMVKIYDYLFIYKEFNAWTSINIIKKYSINNFVIYEKNVCLFLWQLKLMVSYFNIHYIENKFANVVKYKNYLDDGGFDIEYKLYFDKNFDKL